MTTFQGKKVDWSLYPDLLLPTEKSPTFILPRNILRARKLEAFVQDQKRNYLAEDHSNTISRQTIDSILALLNPPDQDENRSPDNREPLIPYRQNRRKHESPGSPYTERSEENKNNPEPSPPEPTSHSHNQEAKDRLSKLISEHKPPLC